MFYDIFERMRTERDQAINERNQARAETADYQVQYEAALAEVAKLIVDLSNAEDERDEASKHRDEMKMLAEVNYNRAEALAVERDEARAELEYSNKSRQYLADRLNEVKDERDEYRADYNRVFAQLNMAIIERDEADETADFWEAQFDDAQANLAKAYAELSNRTLDSLDSDDAIGSEPLLVVFTFGDLD